MSKEFGFLRQLGTFLAGLFILDTFRGGIPDAIEILQSDPVKLPKKIAFYEINFLMEQKCSLALPLIF